MYLGAKVCARRFRAILGDLVEAMRCGASIGREVVMTDLKIAITVGGTHPGQTPGRLQAGGLGRPRDDRVCATTSSALAGDDHD